MKVLRIIARLNVGGPARHVTLVNAGLDARRHDTLLVFGTLDAGEASFENAAQAAGIRTIKLQSLGRRVTPFGDLRAFAEVTRLVFRESPDVVHTHTAKAGTVGRLAAWLFNLTRRRSRRCLIVHTYHGHVFEGYFGAAMSWAIRAVERCLAAITHCIVTISPTQRHDIVQRFRVAPVARTTTVLLGLTLEPLLAMEPGAPNLRGRLGFGTEDVVVGFLGRIVPIKDLPTLIHAFAMALERIPTMRLLLAGDGPERAVLTQLVGRLRIDSRVLFLGWVDDLPRFYATLDIFALSSINEGTPVAIIEAMAAGRPVAASSVGGVVDVVEQDVTGLLVPPRAPGALATALIALSSDADERRRMGEEGRRRAAGYTSGRLVSDLERLYEEGLAEVRSRHRRLP